MATLGEKGAIPVDSVPALRHVDRTLRDAASGPLAPDDIYRDLTFPGGVDEPFARPYTVINMVSTADGKVVVGGPGTTGLIGGPTDHRLMRRIMMATDGELFGAQLIREDNPPYPRLSKEERREREARGLRAEPFWVIVTTGAEFNPAPRAFGGGRDNVAVLARKRIDSARSKRLEERVRLYVCEGEGVDFAFMGRLLREEIGIERLNCLGGPSMNGSLIAAGAADELFLTLAPKVKSGRDLASAIEGEPFPPEGMPELELLSLYSHGSELYLRYRLPRFGHVEKEPIAPE